MVIVFEHDDVIVITRVAAIDDGQGLPEVQYHPQVFWLCSKIVDSGNMVTQKRCFASFGIRPRACAMPVSLKHFLEGNIGEHEDQVVNV